MEMDPTISSRAIIQGVAEAFDRLVRQRGEFTQFTRRSTPFDGKGMENVAICDFLGHIMKSGLCSKECFVISLIYIERLLFQHSEMDLSSRNLHRLVLVSVMVGSKILDDFYCRNMYYAVSGSVSRAELNEMELQLCFLLDFELDVSRLEFMVHLHGVVKDTTMPSVMLSAGQRSLATSQIPSEMCRLPTATALVSHQRLLSVGIKSEKTQAVALWMQPEDDVWRSGSSTPSPTEASGVPDTPTFQLPVADPLGAADAWFMADEVSEHYPAWSSGTMQPVVA